MPPQSSCPKRGTGRPREPSWGCPGRAEVQSKSHRAGVLRANRIAIATSPGDDAKRTLRCDLGVRYGNHECEWLHYFPPRRAGSPVLIYVHGGHWQELSPDDSCFAAKGLVEQGAGFVSVGYGLAPRRTLDEMVASVTLALAWVLDNAGELGVEHSTDTCRRYHFRRCTPASDGTQ